MTKKEVLKPDIKILVGNIFEAKTIDIIKEVLKDFRDICYVKPRNDVTQVLFIIIKKEKYYFFYYRKYERVEKTLKEVPHIITVQDWNTYVDSRDTPKRKISKKEYPKINPNATPWVGKNTVESYPQQNQFYQQYYGMSSDRKSVV